MSVTCQPLDLGLARSPEHGGHGEPRDQGDEVIRDAVEEADRRLDPCRGATRAKAARRLYRRFLHRSSPGALLLDGGERPGLERTGEVGGQVEIGGFVQRRARRRRRAASSRGERSEEGRAAGRQAPHQDRQIPGGRPGNPPATNLRSARAEPRRCSSPKSVTAGWAERRIETEGWIVKVSRRSLLRRHRRQRRRVERRQVLGGVIGPPRAASIRRHPAGRAVLGRRLERRDEIGEIIAIAQQHRRARRMPADERPRHRPRRTRRRRSSRPRESGTRARGRVRTPTLLR